MGGDDILCEEYFCTFKECCDIVNEEPVPEQTSCYDEIEKWQSCCANNCYSDRKPDFLKKLLRHGFANSLIRQGHTEEQVCPSHENEGKKCGSVAINDTNKLKTPCKDGRCTFDQCCHELKPATCLDNGGKVIWPKVCKTMGKVYKFEGIDDAEVEKQQCARETCVASECCKNTNPRASPGYHPHRRRLQ